ncbi:hypothetical protein QOZ80_4AG0316670 [Eleusine coracana subsp. coracana]|nr:hypothetical protein QOZ80_4AG0316670 [Eleusine coracana subsp. coracana]
MEHDTMESPAKKSRVNDAGASSSSSAGDQDRLSALPDCLLHEIMSRLKARQVVQTCVLSTRWRHLWRSVACLDVDQEEFTEVERMRMRMRDGKMAWTINKAEASCWENFEDFTDHLLTNNIAIAALDTFRLRVGNRSRGKGAARWIRYGIKYGAREPFPRIQRDLTTPGS